MRTITIRIEPGETVDIRVQRGDGTGEHASAVPAGFRGGPHLFVTRGGYSSGMWCERLCKSVRCCGRPKRGGGQ